MHTIYVKDFCRAGLDDSAAIAAGIAHCDTLEGERTLVFDGRDWLIEEAILISSGMRIIVDGCTIKQKDKTFDNVFRGSNLHIDPADPFGKPLQVEPLRDVKILGQNGAKIIGPDRNRRGFHPVLCEEQDMVGDFWGWRTLQICLSMADGCEIANLSFSQTRCWCMSFDRCCNVNVHDLHIESNVKNGDGVDFRSGCHHCRVDNITGYTSDDTVACTALWQPGRVYPRRNYLYPLEPALSIFEGPVEQAHIHDIQISNILTGGNHHGIICLAANGPRVYNISIDGVQETGEGQREATVKLYTGYGDGYSPGDLHSIRVTNVWAKAARYAVMCNAQVRDVRLRGIRQDTPGGTEFDLSHPEGICVE